MNEPMTTLSSATDVIAERDKEIGDLLDEVERLRAERDEAQEQCTEMERQAQLFREETVGRIERLRAELAARPTRDEAVREALAAANSEHLVGETDDPDDRCYTYGVTDAARATENLIAADGAEAGEAK